jgi:chitodextrinase
MVLRSLTSSFIRLLAACSVGTGLMHAATQQAASCAQTAVQSAISAASVNDIVAVPAGSCSWGGLTINKAVYLKGAGAGQTNITLSSNNTVTKQTNGVVRISGFRFSKSGGGNESKGFTIEGSWLNAEPVVIENNEFVISGTALFHVNVVGGVIIAKNSFTGDWDDSFIQAKQSQDPERSWGLADTIGNKDTTGKRNIYVEENTFYGGTNQGIDADDAVRVVYRYNTLTYSSFNSHGLDTSPVGVRHFEVYNNAFRHLGGTSQIANQNWAIWIRGGTGVIFNNSIDNLAGSHWGDKSEVRFSIRGAEDARPQGTCANTKYPVPHQIGQSFNGTTTFTDPLYLWNNTGTVEVDADWSWGNPCGFTFSTFFQWGRDAVNTNTPKPGYSSYPYPHPLRTVSNDATPPAAPTNLSAVVASASQINLSWAAATDNVAVTGYFVERCQGASCTNFTQVGSPTAISYSDTGLTAGTVYRYRVGARDAAGNRSSYSAIVNATTSTAPVDTTAPSVPSNVSGTAASSSQINLAWTASTDNVGVTGYFIERCQGSSCSSFAQIATSTAVAYSNTGLTASTTYRYRVGATDAAGNRSGYSNIVTVSTPAAPGDTTAPSVPSNVSATASSATQVNLSWTASTDNVAVTGYKVERCQGTSCTSFAQVGSPTGTSYSDSGVTASTTYRYRVAARDAAGNWSGYSNIPTVTTPAGSTQPAPLPTGNTGISSLYPRDANITSHPDVIFADDFESYTSASQITTKWTQAYHSANTRIATEPGNVFSGNKALEFRVPQQSSEVSNELVKNLNPTEDTIFVRMYTKFEAGFDAEGSSHNGIALRAQYCCPGVPADGTNKFYVGLDNNRQLTQNEPSPGYTNVYTYNPDQRTEWGDLWYSDGTVLPFSAIPGDFGPNFVSRPNFLPKLNQWYSYEIMVKANTPGQRDGRIAVWIDGNLISDFLNVRLRDVATLKMDQVIVTLHIGSNTIRPNLKWYDNVVIARSYIGPMSTSSNLVPPTAVSATIQE